MKIHKLHLGDLGTFTHCQRKFYWEKIARKKSNSKVRKLYYDEGTLGHLFLQEFHTKTSTLEERTKFLEEYDFSAEKKAEGAFLSITKLCELYKRHYASDLETYDALSSEDSIPIQIGGQTIFFTIDLKVLNKKTGNIEIIDHKFYKKGTFISSDSVYCMNQPWSYAMLLEQMQQKTKYFHLNVVFKRQLKFPKPLKSGKISTAETYLSSYTHDDYLAALETTGQDITLEYQLVLEKLKEQDAAGFLRFTVSREPKREEFALRQIKQTLDRVNKKLEVPRLSAEEFEMNFGYGCDGCPYFKLCHAEIQGYRVSDILDFDYEDKEITER